MLGVMDPSSPAGYQPPQQVPPSAGGTAPAQPSHADTIVPPAASGYPSSGAGYPPAAGYPRSHPDYPPAGAGHPSLGAGYRPQGPGYSTQGQPPPGQPPPRNGTQRRAPRTDPGGLVAGLVIAGLGLFFLAGQLEPDIGRFVTLFIGLALLAVFLVRREYGFLVPGSILTGVGIGIAVQPHTTGDTEGGVMLLAIAGGFLGIWLLGSLFRLPQLHWWPLIPGGILTLVGLIQLSRADVEGAIRLWPIILIVLGAIVVGRALLRRT